MLPIFAKTHMPNNIYFPIWSRTCPKKKLYAFSMWFCAYAYAQHLLSICVPVLPIFTLQHAKMRCVPLLIISQSACIYGSSRSAGLCSIHYSEKESEYMNISVTLCVLCGKGKQSIYLFDFPEVKDTRPATKLREPCRGALQIFEIHGEIPEIEKKERNPQVFRKICASCRFCVNLCGGLAQGSGILCWACVLHVVGFKAFNNDLTPFRLNNSSNVYFFIPIVFFPIVVALEMTRKYTLMALLTATLIQLSQPYSFTAYKIFCIVIAFKKEK